MRHFNKVCKGMKVAIAGIMAAAIMVGSTVSSAAEAGEADNKFVRSSFSLGSEDSQEEEIVTNVYEKWSSIKVVGSDNGARVAGKDYTWTMDPDDVYAVENVYRTKDSKISIACGIEKGKKDDYVVVGIIEPDGTARIAKDILSVGHEFTIRKTGNHTVFAQNINSSSITVKFIYY